MPAAVVIKSDGDNPEFEGKITFYVILCTIIAACGGLMFGYDIGISGGVTAMDDFLEKFFPAVYARKKRAHENNYCKYDNQYLQLFTSSLYLAALVASFVASRVCSKLGRKPTMQIASLFFIVGVILNAAAMNIEMLIIGRICLGVGVGFANQAVPLFLSEIAPSKIRGALNITFQLLITVGIFAANMVNYFVANIHPNGWRIALGLAGVPAALLAIGSFIITETPTSLVERQKLEQGRATLKKIRGTESIDAEFNQIVAACEIARRVFNPSCKKDKETVKQTMLLCCKLYISESRNNAALDSIEGAARLDPEAVLVNKFEDRAYNRVRYTLVSYVAHDSTGNPIYSPLQETVLAMVDAAYEAINLELHSGTHPRLGVVDHIGFHPLARASLEEAAWLAKSVAADIGNKFQVPVFLYEAAHPSGKALDTIRRELGYFRPNSTGNQWAGWALPEILSEKPDEGPSFASRTRGIAMIGASPWVATYNVPILSTDVVATRRIARMVSARGGGLPTVQTLGLVHGEDSTEIACMLLEPNQVGADRVQNRIELLAAQEGLDVEQGYFTDFSPEMVVEKYMKLVYAADSEM